MVQYFQDGMIDAGMRTASIEENLRSSTELNAVNYGLSKLPAVVFKLRVGEFAFVGSSNLELLFPIGIDGGN